MNPSKIQEEYIDTRYGFPIRLLNVPMIKVRDVWTPKINYRRLELDVLKALATKPSPLTGQELHFIRHSFEMTLESFAERFSVTHPAVMKWEQKDDQPTRMSWSTEKDIRLAIYEQVSASEFQALYRQLQARPKPDSANELKISLDQTHAVGA